MSHPFGDLLSRYLHRKHGLSQSKLAEGILQDPSIITKMCKGRRLSGIQARERVVAIIGWLRTQAAIETVAEANALLAAAGMAPLRMDEPGEQALLRQLQLQPLPPHAQSVRSASVTTRRTNLPAALTSFIGRTQELADVAQRIVTQRLVTLTGAGGVGKTRLATEAGIRFVQGTDASAFAHGVWLMELAELSQPTLVPQALVRLFKLPEQIGQTPLELLQEYLVDKHLLLILDNCEHLVETCAAVVEHLLHHCWRLHVLATSREELRIPGETIYPVLPLALPDPLEHNPEQLLASSAVRLFVERIGAGTGRQQAYREDAATIAQICRQLDGIPLALELAAPLTRSMPLIEIAAQLDNQMAILTNTYRTAIPRHETMHSALVWSYRLLAPAEQQLLARVSVFADGWTLEAVYAVCDGTPAADLRLSLQQLVAKSLVVEEKLDGRRRYRLLEPVRQFARAQLAASGEQDALCRWHAAFFVALAETLEPLLHTAEQHMAYTRLEIERDNLHAALQWALDADPALALQFAGALGYFWMERQYNREGRHWLEQVLARSEAAPGEGPRALRALTLVRAGELTWKDGDLARAAVLGQEGLSLFDTLGDSWGTAYGTQVLGHVARAHQDYATATKHYTAALAGFRHVGDQEWIAWTLGDLSAVAQHEGDLEQARAWAEESVALFRELNNHNGLSWSLFVLTNLVLRQGEVAQAATLNRESEQLCRDLGNLRWLPIVLLQQGNIACVQHDTVRATQLYAESLVYFRDGGSRRGMAMALIGFAKVAWEGTRSTAMARRAGRLLGAAEASFERGSTPIYGAITTVFARHAETIRGARAELGESTFRAAWGEGHAMTPEQAVAYALEEDESATIER